MSQEEKITELESKITLLKKAVHSFEWRIDELEREVKYLKAEINHASFSQKSTFEQESVSESVDKFATNDKVAEEKVYSLEDARLFTSEKDAEPATESSDASPFPNINVEEWIGGNLLSKLGILILLIGLGYFVKYAIDHDLVSPLGRVILAYMAGIGLVGLAQYLKSNYKAYSAVLLSGGVATAYFTTYFAFIFWQLMPQWTAFGLMFLLTVYVVWEATKFDEEIIGIIGLVAAYCIPIILSKESGNVAIMLGYMAIINGGVLRLAFLRNWNRMNLTSFVATWLIFLLWFLTAYSAEVYGTTLLFNLVFFGMFYVILIAYHLSEKKILQEGILFAVFINTLLFYGIGWFVLVDRVGLDEFFNTKYQNPYISLTLFTLFNAILQGLIGFYLWKKTSVEKQLKYLAIGWAITFLTIAIVVFFEGEWIMALWTIESILLFAVSQREKIKFFEYLSYVISILSIVSVPFCWAMQWWSMVWFVETLALMWAFLRYKNRFLETFCYLLSVATAISVPYYFESEGIIYGLMIELLVLYGLGRFFHLTILENISLSILVLVWVALLGYWDAQYSSEMREVAGLFWNPVFGMSMVVCGGMLGLIALHQLIPQRGGVDSFEPIKGINISQMIRVDTLDILVIGLLVGLYGSIAQDLRFLLHFANPIADTNDANYNHWRYLLNNFSRMLILLFTSVYLSLCIGGVLRFGQRYPFIQLILGSSFVFTLYFLLNYGITVRSIVWESYQLRNTPYTAHLYLMMRFVVYLMTGIIVILNFYLIQKTKLHSVKLFKRYVIWLNIFVLVVLSLELQNLWILNSNLPLGEALEMSSKLGFTVLWVVYAVGMISYGIRYKRKYLRMAGFWIIGIALLKLFAADLSYNSPLQVMIAFVSVGILLLMTAFLYQKFKDLILAKDE